MNPKILDILDETRARVRLIELALLGSGNSGVSLNDQVYRDALTQQSRDIAISLDALRELLSPAQGAAGAVLHITPSADVSVALDKAKAAIGGNTNLAMALGGITPQAVSQWRHVPASRVLDV